MTDTKPRNFFIELWTNPIPHKAQLLDTPAFKAVWRIGGAVALSIYLVILNKENLNGEFCGKAECFEYFLTTFSFPLWCLATTGALLTLIATAHRSAAIAHQIELTTKQINQTSQQNALSNHYQNIKEFKEHIGTTEKQLQRREETIFENIAATYKQLFPNSKDGEIFLYSQTTIEGLELKTKETRTKIQTKNTTALEIKEELEPLLTTINGLLRMTDFLNEQWKQATNEHTQNRLTAEYKENHGRHANYKLFEEFHYALDSTLQFCPDAQDQIEPLITEIQAISKHLLNLTEEIQS